MPDYKLAARRAAKRAGIDPNIFERQIAAESGFNPNAQSPAGAQGIAQFIPSTAAQYGVNLHDGRVSDDLAGAARMMRDALRRTGSYTKALSIYNSGRPDGYKRFSETAAYVKKILDGANPSASVGVTGGEAHVPGGSVTVQEPTFDQAGFDKARRAALVGMLLAKHDPNSLVLRSGLATTTAPNPADFQGSKLVHLATSRATASSAAPHNLESVLGMKGTIHFDGKPVAAWVGHILQYARDHGWKGGLSSGYRTDAQQAAIYNSGVRPAAVPKSMGGAGSNHEGDVYPLGAADVTNASQLAGILRRSPYAKILQWAGSKDPVHFSHPHGGSY